MVYNKIIFSISMVKNEMDIIESFVRYNVNYLDGMIILDNGSTDSTLKILESLKNEGLPIFVLEDDTRDFDKILKMNQLLHKAVEEFNADIIVPLDADEFMLSSKGGSPREFLEKLKSPDYFVAKWKVYVPDFDINGDEKFIPSKITMARDDSSRTGHTLYKVIIPKELVIDYGVQLTRGSHSLVFNPIYKNVLNRVINPDLNIAHFPIRSKEQTISKVAVGWLNAISSVEKKPNDSFHWKKIFNQLKAQEDIEDEDIVAIATEFSCENDNTEKIISEDPMDLSFSTNIELKYTKEKINPMSNLLEACEWLSQSCVNAKKENIRLENKIKGYENSISWKITSPLRKIKAIAKKLR
ncbi:glycosyltransferase family 2 protein [Methanobacterium sp. VT]|uniref:Glycosyltransferase family 2 protein n=1 Tax=Methanobacterium spitsbergense TaxID=2874285 RepID=A0A8T5V0W4_9EURY|nr:glycosyltransferase family 2 protein [Methanobacterium spitsbergense]MBZ2167090.1 glycosyltransferase family 2 protein [Methanobacterium spitsbergense]